MRDSASETASAVRVRDRRLRSLLELMELVDCNEVGREEIRLGEEMRVDTDGITIVCVVDDRGDGRIGRGKVETSVEGGRGGRGRGCAG